MKRVFCHLMLLLLVCVPAAHAERLTMQVTDTLLVDAELPEIPERISALKLKFRPADPKWAGETLMPGVQPNPERLPDVTTFGDPEDPEGYMLVRLDAGRVYYESSFYGQYLAPVLRISDPSVDWSRYYQAPDELPFMSRAEALKKAEDLLTQLGASAVGEPTVYTVSTEAHAALQADLKLSMAQIHIHRRVFEPLPAAHEGYYISFPIGVEGRAVDIDGLQYGGLYLSRQGVEYIDNGYAFELRSAAPPKRVLSPQAVLAKSKRALADIGLRNYGDERAETPLLPATIERISLIYLTKYGKAGMTCVPVWYFEYRESLRDRRIDADPGPLDGRSRMREIAINAHTGRLIHLNRI